MTGAELRHDSADRKGMALNALLGVACEAVNAAADVMLLPSLVLAFFVAELTPSYPLIGLVPALAMAFWTLARVPAHFLTGERRRKQPWAFAAALVRAAAIAVLAIVASRTSPVDLVQSARPLLGTLFLCLVVYALASGFSSVPSAALLRAAVAGEAWHRFVRWRSLASAGLSLAGALVVARLLGSESATFPGSYGRLFLVATIFLVAAAVFTVAMREPAVPASLLTAPSLSPRAWRQPIDDARYRRFLVFRVLLSATAAIDPFLFLYAVTRLGVPTTALGGYVLAGVLGWVISAPIWLRLDQRSGPRAVLQGATVVRLVAPAVALALPPIAGSSLMRDQFPDASPAVTIYGVVFFAIGAALAAQSRGNHDHIAALAPRPLLSTYAALTNAILAVVAFAPVLGGLLIERSGYEALFLVAAALGLLAVFASGWLAFTPARPRDRLDPLRTDVPAAQTLPAARV
jgi:MFS family permease